MTNLDSRDITLPTKVRLVKAMVFPVVLYGCESWSIIESWEPKNWCFWTVVLEKPLESPLDYKEIQPVNSKGNQSWIFIEGLMLKLKLQYLGHLMGRTDSLEKTLILGRIEGRRKGDNRGWDGWMASPTQWTWVWASSGSWWWTGKPGVLQSMGLQRVSQDWATELNHRKWGFSSTFSIPSLFSISIPMLFIASQYNYNFWLHHYLLYTLWWLYKHVIYS